VGRELGRGRRRPTALEVRGRREEAGLELEEPPRDEGARRRAPDADREIDALGEQVLDVLRQLDAQPQRRVAHAERGELRREQRAAEVGRRRHDDLPRRRTRGIGARPQRRLELGERRGHAPQQRGTLGGEAHRARRPHEQRVAEVGLERRDSRGSRGTCRAARARRPS
jgi:hypothetical protein